MRTRISEICQKFKESKKHQLLEIHLQRHLETFWQMSKCQKSSEIDAFTMSLFLVPSLEVRQVANMEEK